MGRFSIAVLAFLLSLISVSYGAKIFAYVPTCSYSHQVVFQPIWKELSLRGHKVTVLTTNPVNDKSLTNLTEIDLSFSYHMFKNLTTNIFIVSGVLESIEVTWTFFNQYMALQLESPEIQQFINEGPFDVVIAEYLTPIPFAFAEKFKCPSIGITSFAPMEYIYQQFGMPTHPVLWPAVLPFSSPDSLLLRILSVFYDLYFEAYNRLYNIPVQEELIKKHFGRNAATPLELMNKMSLLLENTIPGIHPVRPRVPLVVPIGGIHKVPAKPLPKELKTTLDSATNGFIYFSLGSNVKSTERTSAFKQVLLETFAELPYTVLWKFEQDDLADVPKNVVILKWVPQTDVLSHPNIKLFITQGGLQSVEETVTAKVPIVGIPFFGDQFRNVFLCVENGFGIYLDHNTLDKDTFKKSILEVIDNPKYKQTIAEASDLARDQPMSSLDRAVWWIEYVIRHNGTEHLRSPVLKLPWYQYYMIDVIGTCVTVLVLVLYLCYLIVRTVLRLIKRVFCKTAPLKKKKN